MIFNSLEAWFDMADHWSSAKARSLAAQLAAEADSHASLARIFGEYRNRAADAERHERRALFLGRCATMLQEQANMLDGYAAKEAAA